METGVTSRPKVRGAFWGDGQVAEDGFFYLLGWGRTGEATPAQYAATNEAMQEHIADRGGTILARCATETFNGSQLGPWEYYADHKSGTCWSAKPSSLRSFYGGLLTTCGLSFVGNPETDSEEENQELGIHGRIANIPAKRVSIAEGWVEDDYSISLKGTMRETIVFGVNLELTRTITLKLGEKRFFINDRVENLNRIDSSPLVIVDHCNTGFPLLGPSSRLILSSRQTVDSEDSRIIAPDVFTRIDPPGRTAKDDLFIHDPVADKKGFVNLALVNESLGDGLGLYWRYPKTELPILNQWQHFTAGTYVMGIEPGNCSVMGRKANREADTLQSIAPGEIRSFNMEIGILEGPQEIKDFENNLV